MPIYHYRKWLIACVVTLALVGVVCFINYYYLDNPNSIIPNRALEAVIRKQICKPKGDIKPEDCLAITELDLSFSDFNTSLEGLQYFLYLEKLNCAAGSISDISALSGLTELRELRLYKNHVSDLTPLSNLYNLEDLDLYDNNVSDLTPLSSLSKLKYLNIGKNPVDESEDGFEPLSHLYGLTISSNKKGNITIKAPLNSEY